MTAKRPPEPAIALFIFVAALAYFQRTLHLTLELRDEGFLLLNIARAANGEIPHRDFLEIYGPGVYALTAPIFGLFGDRVMPVRELLAVLRAAAVAFSYLIARHFVPRPFALLGALFASAYWGWSIWSLTTPYAALYTIPLCMLSFLLLLAGESRDSGKAYIGSGFVCGAALLFKWSLAAVSAYGMVLAICASAMLRKAPDAGSRAYRAAVLAAWLLAGSLILVPFREILSPFDYLLHFAPIHALIALVAIRFARFGDGRSAFARALPRIARYCAGFLVAPLAVGAIYLAWGSLGDLLYNTVFRPMHYRNYYVPVGAPPASSMWLLLGIAAGVSGALALLRGSRRLAIAFFAVATMTAPFAWRSVAAAGSVPFALERLIVQLPAITAFAALLLIAVILARGRALEHEQSLAALIAALFFQQMMSFQIFPRGSYNITLMLGTLAPVVAYLTHRWYSLAAGADAPLKGLGRPVAFLLAALLPALFTVDKVRYAITAPQPGDLAHTALRAPALAGIHPKPEAWERQDLASFDQLISRLEAAEPADAPLFVMNNEPMIYLVSGREALFEDQLLFFFLAGWKLLPENDRDMPSEPELIQRFEQNPEAIVVMRRRDKSAANVRKFFPQLARYIRANYQVEDLIGDYRIMRRTGTR